MNAVLRAALLPVLLLAAFGASAAAAEPRTRPALDPLEGEVIVRFKPGAGLLRQHVLAARADAGTVRDTLTRRARTLGVRWGRSLDAGTAIGARTQVLRAAGVDAATLARQLAADPDVEYAVPNTRQRILAAPNDPLYAAAAPGVRPSGPDSGQWYLRPADATVRSTLDIEAAWARTLGSANVVVAVIDTGVRPEHPDLAGRMLPGYDFVSDSVSAGDGDGRDGDPSDPGDFISQADLNTDATRPIGQRRFSGCSVSSSSWHGTGTTALVGAAANNGVGIAGTAPGVTLLPLRALGKCGTGKTSDIHAAMLWAAGISVPGVPDNPNPAKVINLSLGGSGACTAAYQDVVDQVLARGVVIVAAAGNSAGGAVSEPASCRGVIGVLALRHIGTKVGFSDLGPEVSIAAPGGNCVNATANSPCLYPIVTATDQGTQGPLASGWTDSYKASLGTSFSSPLVAGVAALMFSVQPALTPTQLRTAMRATARPFPSSGADAGPDGVPIAQCQAPVNGVQQLQCYCTTALCGAGMVDAGAAVAAVAGVVAQIGVSTASPTAGSPVQLSAAGSSAGAGRSIVAWNWVLLNGGGIVSGFASATNASTVSFTPSAAGSVTVRLTVTDDLGLSADTQTTVAVAAAAVATPLSPPATVSPSGGGGGGGAMSAPWLIALAGAVWALRRKSAVPVGR